MVLLSKCYFLAINSVAILDCSTPLWFREMVPYKYLKVEDWQLGEIDFDLFC